MSIKIGDILKPLNETFPITLSEDVKGAMKSVNTKQEMLNIQDNRLSEGTICYVVTENMYYKYNGTEWVELNFTDVAVLENEPENKNVLWVDTKTGPVTVNINPTEFEDLKTTVSVLQLQYTKLSLLLNTGVISGGPHVGIGTTTPENEQEAHTVSNIGFKRGNLQDFYTNRGILVNGEPFIAKGYDNNWNFYIYINGEFIKYTGTADTTTYSSNSPTSLYSASNIVSTPDIIKSNNIVTINNKILSDNDINEAILNQKVSVSSIINDNIKISQVFLGDNIINTDSAYTDSYIELFNTSVTEDIDITGLYILYVTDNNILLYLLNGVIKANSTYIIKCNKVGIESNITKPITHYDEICNSITFNNVDNFDIFVSYQYVDIPTKRIKTRAKKSTYIDKLSVIPDITNVYDSTNTITKIQDIPSRVYVKTDINDENSVLSIHPYLLNDMVKNMIYPGTRKQFKFNLPLYTNKPNWISIIPAPNIITDLDTPASFNVTWTIYGYHKSYIKADDNNVVLSNDIIEKRWFYLDQLVTTFTLNIKIKNNITFEIYAEIDNFISNIYALNIDTIADNSTIEINGNDINTNLNIFNSTDNNIYNNIIIDLLLVLVFKSKQDLNYKLYNNLDSKILLPMLTYDLYNELKDEYKHILTIKNNIYSVIYGDYLITVVGEVNNDILDNMLNDINNILVKQPNYKHCIISYTKNKLDLSAFDNIIYCMHNLVIHENIER